MVQIIKEYSRPRSSEKFGEAILRGGMAAGEAIPEFMQERAEIDAGKRYGLDLQGIPKETRAKAFEQAFKLNAEKERDLSSKFMEKEKNLADQFLEKESYNKIKDTFGEKFADIWKAAPQGGKTELLKHGIDAKLRGADLNQLLEGVESPASQESNDLQQPPKMPQMKDGELPKEIEWPDYTRPPSGYTPKDWKDERKGWRKENSPIFLENKTKLQNSKRDEVSINKLDKLNKSRKIAEGFERTLINPETGEPYALAQLTGNISPETQEWVKEIARFQNRAKDAFGSRVTNFDLVSYMKQFPGLLNTNEGRKRIIEMMKINNKLDRIHESALEKVYQHYGLNGIPQEEADKLAQTMIKEETENLRNKYLGLDEENQNEGSQELSGRMIDVIGPDGQEYEIDESEVDQLPEGFRII